MTLAVQHCYRPLYFPNVLLLSGILAVFLVSQAVADDPRNDPAFWNSLEFTPIHVMQGVDTSGVKTWEVPTYNDDWYLDPENGEYQAYKLRGIVLNDPAKMLDSTPDDGSYVPGGSMGGEWQIYVQAVDREDNPAELIDDFGGVSLWMGQNYGNRIRDPEMNYPPTEWESEMQRLNYPKYITGGHVGDEVDSPLRSGDFIEIYARGGAGYNGKFNCNEQHFKTDNYDFDIYIVDRNLALPLENENIIELNAIKTNNNEFIFDSEYPTREFGGEYYQGQRVRLRNVRITNAENWAAYGTLIVTDDDGRYFNVKLGDNSSFDNAPPPSKEEYLDVIGIFDQEGVATGDYRMWALSPDDFLSADLLPGDANMDNVVDDRDATIMAVNWNKLHDAYWKHGDFNGDGQVNHADAALLAANWLQSAPPGAAAPEPGVMLLIISGGLMFRMLLKW